VVVGGGGWLIDKSAYTRLASSPDAELWVERANRGLLHLGVVTRLEIGYSARSGGDYRAEEDGLLRKLVAVLIPPQAERRAVDVQRMLADRGDHRGPSVPDLLVAAVAEVRGLTVLHLDHDFDDIAAITGQAVVRLRT
jgi:predicted nucleic acid-binding protein